jgi:hypothetical protein
MLLIPSHNALEEFESLKLRCLYCFTRILRLFGGQLVAAQRRVTDLRLNIWLPAVQWISLQSSCDIVTVNIALPLFHILRYDPFDLISASFQSQNKILSTFLKILINLLLLKYERLY